MDPSCLRCDVDRSSSTTQLPRNTTTFPSFSALTATRRTEVARQFTFAEGRWEGFCISMTTVVNSRDNGARAQKFRSKAVHRYTSPPDSGCSSFASM